MHHEGALSGLHGLNLTTSKRGGYISDSLTRTCWRLAASGFDGELRVPAGVRNSSGQTTFGTSRALGRDQQRRQWMDDGIFGIWTDGRQVTILRRVEAAGGMGGRGSGGSGWSAEANWTLAGETRDMACVESFERGRVGFHTSG
jgi:hypothetical protein